LSVRLAASARPKLAEQLVGPSRGRLLLEVAEPPHHAQVLVPGQVLVDVAYCPARPIERRTTAARLTTSLPRIEALPSSGVRMVERMRTARRLPRAVGPEEPEDGAGLDLKGEAVEGSHAPLGEDLDEVARDDGSGFVHGGQLTDVGQRPFTLATVHRARCGNRRPRPPSGTQVVWAAQPLQFPGRGGPMPYVFDFRSQNTPSTHGHEGPPGGRAPTSPR